MHQIFMWGQNFAAITDRIEADLHKHWLLQLFIATDKALSIKVEDTVLNCKAVLVNLNTRHAFYSNSDTHFTMLIDPTTVIGRAMRLNFLDNASFYVMEADASDALCKGLKSAIANEASQDYKVFFEEIQRYFYKEDSQTIDYRIELVLQWIDSCGCEEPIIHKVRGIADEIGLSESRLSHLFKNETGIPLKSYIVLHMIKQTYQRLFSGYNITQAALESGFDSPSHFAFVHKKMTGMSARGLTTDSRFLKVDF